jgi:Methyltransferase domain
MRRRRFSFFLSLLSEVKRPVRILDVGGTPEFWQLMGLRRLDDVRITIFNLQAQSVPRPVFENAVGDARDLSRYGDKSFDVVFSNSVIEHLGPEFSDQQRMAKEIDRVGQRYFVQTPNRYFPLEPHFLVPGFQFMPVWLRTLMVSSFDVGWYKRIPDKATARAEVESVSLLSRKQLRTLFPKASISEEKLLGITKSFVAFGGWDATALVITSRVR